MGVGADRPPDRPSPEVAASPVPSAAILLVDDEAGITKAVLRLLQRRATRSTRRPTGAWRWPNSRSAPMT